VIQLSDLFLYDSHIHTTYSGHSHPEMSVEAIIQEASRKHMIQIAITEHVFFESDQSKIATIANQIPPSAENVVLGVEMDADAEALDGTLVGSTEGIDWVIASFHRFPGTSIWWHDGDFQDVKEEKTIYREWFEWVHKVIEVGRPDALGHLGVMICQLSIVEEFDEPILQDFREILRSCREHGVALELNEGTHKKMRPSQKDTYYRVFQLAKKEKVKIVLGSDAHSLPQIGRYVWAREIIDRVGIEMKDCVAPVKRISSHLSI